MASLALHGRERACLTNIIKHTAGARERARAQAVLWVAQGQPIVEVAELLQVSRQTVHNWIERFQERDGEMAACFRDASRSGRPAAAKGQLPLLLARVFDQTPRDFGYHATGWTAPLLVAYLEDYHGLPVSTNTVHRVIAELGLRWKRPRHQWADRLATWRQSKATVSGVKGECC
jgi:transposase